MGDTLDSDKNFLDDDFEFRPITKGLGFHKKPISLKEEVVKTELINKALPKSVPHRPAARFLQQEASVDEALTYEDILLSLGESEPVRALDSMADSIEYDVHSTESVLEDLDLSKTFQREQQASPDIQPSEVSMPTMPLRDIDQNIERKPFSTPRPTIMPRPGTNVRRSSSNAPESKLEKAPICVGSMVLDSVLVTSLSLIFTVSLLYVTQVSVPLFLSNLKSDLPTQLSFGVLYLSLYQMYVVVTRSFFGSTLGEWTFEHQLGNEKDQKRGLYPLKVVWRSLIIVMTGFVVLPLLSFIFRKDIIGFFSGLDLYKRR